jgi:pimeloyl-ACP methyl ester carboxylesterase
MADGHARLESKYVTVEGVRIHWQEKGEGYPLICLHGAGPGANAERNFKHNVDAFSQKYRTLLVDMPQYGKSDKVVITEGRLTYNARILNGFMEAVGLSQAHMVGNSMGGQVALKLGLAYPQRTSRIVAIGSGAVPPVMTPFPAEGIRMIARYYKGSGPSRDKLRELLGSIVYDSSFLTDEVFEERYQASIEPDVVELFSRKQGPMISEYLTADLPRLQAKFLGIWGADDRFGSLDVGIQITRLVPNGRLHMFAKCGHWAQVEHAAEFNEVVLGFLQS